MTNLGTKFADAGKAAQGRPQHQRVAISDKSERGDIERHTFDVLVRRERAMYENQRAEVREQRQEFGANLEGRWPSHAGLDAR